MPSPAPAPPASQDTEPTTPAPSPVSGLNTHLAGRNLGDGALNEERVEDMADHDALLRGFVADSKRVREEILQLCVKEAAVIAAIDAASAVLSAIGLPPIASNLLHMRSSESFTLAFLGIAGKEAGLPATAVEEFRKTLLAAYGQRMANAVPKADSRRAAVDALLDAARASVDNQRVEKPFGYFATGTPLFTDSTVSKNPAQGGRVRGRR